MGVFLKMFLKCCLFWCSVCLFLVWLVILCFSVVVCLCMRVLMCWVWFDISSSSVFIMVVVSRLIRVKV